MELLIGCGARREKKIFSGSKDWNHLVTLDIEPSHKPDIVHDLNNLPYPFDDNQFAEIHAYEVLEHTGRQGDLRFFFGQFDEFHRILKPNGVLCGTCPRHDHVWAWSDPGHTRVITAHTLTFLDRDAYGDIGNSPMADYRPLFKSHFKLDWHQVGDVSTYFVLRAVK